MIGELSSIGLIALMAWALQKKEEEKGFLQNTLDAVDPLPSTLEYRPNTAANNPLLDMNSRSLQDFTHNNMVPHFGSKVTQDMRGTGLEPNNVNIGANITPNQHKLALMTGCDEEAYRHKKEAPAFFQPEPGHTYTFGAPVGRPDLNRYIAMHRERPDLMPTETCVRVGPGLGLDPSVPAEGGFHSFTRVMPNNVNDYKANQLPGRVAGGKYQLSNKPTATTDTPKNRPNTYWTLEDRPIGPARSYITGQRSIDNNATMRDTARSQLVQGYEGNPNTHVPKNTMFSDSYRNPNNNIRSKSDCNLNEYGRNLGGASTWMPSTITLQPTHRESTNYWSTTRPMVEGASKIPMTV